MTENTVIKGILTIVTYLQFHWPHWKSTWIDTETDCGQNYSKSLRWGTEVWEVRSLGVEPDFEANHILAPRNWLTDCMTCGKWLSFQFETAAWHFNRRNDSGNGLQSQLQAVSSQLCNKTHRISVPVTIIRDTIYFTTVFICRTWYLRKDRANTNNRVFETLSKSH